MSSSTTVTLSTPKPTTTKPLYHRMPPLFNRLPSHIVVARNEVLTGNRRRKRSCYQKCCQTTATISISGNQYQPEKEEANYHQKQLSINGLRELFFFKPDAHSQSLSCNAYKHHNRQLSGRRGGTRQKDVKIPRQLKVETTSHATLGSSHSDFNLNDEADDLEDEEEEVWEVRSWIGTKQRRKLS
nr:hypothetical protein [Tanacetum cinerariifolium]